MSIVLINRAGDTHIQLTSVTPSRFQIIQPIHDHAGNQNRNFTCKILVTIYSYIYIQNISTIAKQILKNIYKTNLKYGIQVYKQLYGTQVSKQLTISSM